MFRKNQYLKLAATFVFAIFYFSSNAQINLNKGLVAYYPFNGDVKDYSGNNNHGTIMGSPTLVNDKDGNSNWAYKFNGNGDYIRVADDSTLRPDSAITVSAWVYCEDFSSWNIVVSKRAAHNSSPWNSYLLYASGTAGSPQNWGFGVATGQSKTHFAIDPVVANTKKWIHLIGIYEKNPLAPSANSTQSVKNVRVYVDCKLVKEAVGSGDIYYTDSSLRIGMAIPGPSKQFFKGMIDDVRIYNRGLNDSEINALCTEKFVKTTNINGVNKGLYNIYPNPTTSELYISKRDNIEIKKVIIYDVTGKQLIKVEDNDISQVKVDKLPKGVYFISLLDSFNQYTTQKLIKN